MSGDIYDSGKNEFKPTHKDLNGKHVEIMFEITHLLEGNDAGFENLTVYRDESGEKYARYSPEVRSQFKRI